MQQFFFLLSALASILFFIQLLYDFKTEKESYLVWWSIAAACFCISVLMTGYCDNYGYRPFPAKFSYITGPILSCFPFAQGVILIFGKDKFHKYTSIFWGTLVLIAIIGVIYTPFQYRENDEHRIIGLALQWKWIRTLSTVINLWSLAFFMGGVFYAAFKLTERSFEDSGFWGYLLIGIGAFIPALDGYLVHAGYEILLGAMEFLGISLILLGYQGIRNQ